jgi:hypothetical protein
MRLSTTAATAPTMFRFLRQHAEQEIAIEPVESFFATPNDCVEYTITREDGRREEYITIIDSGQGRVSLEVGFNAVKMTRLIESGLLVDREFMGYTVFEVSGYGKIDVFMTKSQNKSGVLKFQMGCFREAKARALFDALLVFFPSIHRRTININTALAMALHPRLGADSCLAELGDGFSCVLKLL